MDLKHKLVLISMILITILCVSCVSVVSASSLGNDLTDYRLSEQNDLQSSLEYLRNNEDNLINEENPDSADLIKNSSDESTTLNDGEEEEQPDTPDLIHEESTDVNYVYPSNIKKYFPNGILDPKYENKTFVFIGDFEDLGKLTINAPYVNISGLNANLRNIVFDIQKTNVCLSNLNLVLDKEFEKNHGAAIFVASDNAILNNLTINYTVPDNVEAYGILVNEFIDRDVENLRITNSQINFEGHNEDLDVYNCAVKLIGAYDSIMENNTIICSLPLKLIN